MKIKIKSKIEKTLSLLFVNLIPEIFQNYDGVKLIRMNRSVKYLFYSWNSICDNDYLRNVLYLYSLVYSTSNSKKFSLNRIDIHGMMNRFIYDVLTFSNVQDWGGNIILDTCIDNNKHCVLISKWVFIESIVVRF